MIYKSNFIDEIKSQWNLNRKMLIVESIGILFGIIGALLIMLLRGDAPFFSVYSIFLISSLLMMWAAFYQKNSRLMFLNVIYLIINLTGLMLSN